MVSGAGEGRRMVLNRTACSRKVPAAPGGRGSLKVALCIRVLTADHPDLTWNPSRTSMWLGRPGRSGRTQKEMWHVMKEEIERVQWPSPGLVRRILDAPHTVAPQNLGRDAEP